MFTALPLYAYSLLRVRYQLATPMDIAALGTFFMGVAVCFTLSTMYAKVSLAQIFIFELTRSVQFPHLRQS